MPIYAPQKTLDTLGNGLLPKCTSRSLFQARFADPASEKDERKAWFNALINKSAETPKRSDWLPASAVSLHARLMSRLMVDLASGVMENAHVLLDRFGLPTIPGSTIKGCARRMALQALHDWIEAGGERPSPEDIAAPCCQAFSEPAEMLAASARVFGWVEQDWSAPFDQSDFFWASHADPALLAAARALLPATDHFAGTIAFLPAHPNADPGLELDVVTPHHSAYYSRDLKIATDTEDPVPVFFPAVKPQKTGDYFTFPLFPLHLAKDGDLAHAKLWLAHGLEIFGLGAKTNAGYGWFEIVSETDVQEEQARKAAAASDYSSEVIFKNSVLDRTNKPQEYPQLQKQILLLGKPENSAWLQKLKAHLASPVGKDACKRLKKTDWFPKDWLPL